LSGTAAEFLQKTGISPEEYLKCENVFYQILICTGKAFSSDFQNQCLCLI